MFHRVTFLIFGLFWMGCDDGADQPPGEIVNIGDVAGGAGGEMAGGAGGETAGGAGGEMAGGAGGEMAGGAGGGMAGGAGGDGPCMPDCPIGSECEAGECRFVGCPDGLLECDGLCVDLLSDAENCGSCGSSCREGFEAWESDFGFEIQCVDAECRYQCPQDPQVTRVSDLEDDAQHCGTCGAICNAQCVDYECVCALRPRGTPNSFNGVPCGDDCDMGGQNCEDGCCPQLPMGAVDGVGVADTAHAFRFVLDAASPMRFAVEDGQCAGVVLVRFFEDDVVGLIALSEDCVLDEAMLERGSYGLEVSFSDDGPYRLVRSVPPAEVDFVAPGNDERVDTDSSLGFRFTVAEDRAYEMQLANLGDAPCQGTWELALFTADGRQIAFRRGGRCERDGLTSQVIRSRLAAGDYVLQARAQLLAGQRYRLDIEGTQHGTIVADDVQVEGLGEVGLRLDRYETKTYISTFPAGARRLRVVGETCDVALEVAQFRRFTDRIQVGDTIRQFRVEQLYDIAANNDVGESLNPSLTFEAAADDIYHLQVISAGFINNCTLVIE
ncbi:MAG: hypothetical protein ACI9U2_000415 [Bradymonadia bacterium]|jgi:hypothetical protein